MTEAKSIWDRWPGLIPSLVPVILGLMSAAVWSTIMNPYERLAEQVEEVRAVVREIQTVQTNQLIVSATLTNSVNAITEAQKELEGRVMGLVTTEQLQNELEQRDRSIERLERILERVVP